MPHVVAGLMREWLLDYFIQGRRPVTFRQNRMIVHSIREEDDLLRASLPAGSSLPNWIGVRVALEFDDRLVKKPDGSQELILICDVSSRLILDASIAELTGRGLSVTGMYVRKKELSRDSRLMPHMSLVGRVREIRGGQVILDDGVEGMEILSASEAYLEPRPENLERVIRALEPQRADAILLKLAGRKASLAAGPLRLARIRQSLEYIGKQRPLVSPDLTLTFGRLIATGMNFPDWEIFEKPELIFDSGGRKTHRWNQGGLDTFGPCDRFQFTPKNLNIAVICQASKQGRVERFVQALLKGLPNKTGFLQRFALEKPYVRVFTARSAEAADYAVACSESLTHITDSGKRWNLAIVQIDDGMDELVGDANPYLTTKAFFLRRDVGVQDIEFSTMEQHPDQLSYTLNNIGLAAYAKIGGVPWLLPADQKVSHELVIGLGSIETTTSRLGGRERFVGITTVFTGDGRYLLESRTHAVPFAEYPQELLQAIKRAVEVVKREQNWATKDPIRLVFHAFKPMKDAEVDAAKSLMRGLGYPHAQFAFVHVADNHSFLVLDEDEQGANAPGQTRKGVLAPPRGLAVRLSRHEVLLALKGARDVKRASDGVPRPVLLRLHRDSTFTDMAYLSRQVFHFACHSWRSFFPAPMPITIGYSQIVADKLRLLQDVSGWSPDDVLGPVGRTRWFL